MARKTPSSPQPVVQESFSQLAFTEALEERYLSYALSTIKSRSLPDARDGMKPVQRRLLYAMHLLKLNPKSNFKKSARVVGDVIGKYHPHGDQSIYDALVRLAQDFSLRYPLVEGQGNFGNIDGDSAAAMRYTEARLTCYAEMILENLNHQITPYIDNYDGQDQEPQVLPGRFPQLLANGAQGIAVGMATSIPSHNLEELIAALVHLVDHPESSVSDLMKWLKGPDFPTGGILYEKESHIQDVYEKGRGILRIRARWEEEEVGRSNYQIVVTEIPYQVQKSRLIEKLAQWIRVDNTCPLVNLRDESAEDIRLVLEPRSCKVSADLVMEALFAKSDLEVKFQVNLNALDRGVGPMSSSIRALLLAYLTHRKETLLAEHRYRENKAQSRVEILQGYQAIFINLDEVIRIIREEDDPKSDLMKTFSLSERQAEAILELRLRSLRRLEEMKILAEKELLEKEIEYCQDVLNSEAKLKTVLKEDLRDVQLTSEKNYPDLTTRRTEIRVPEATQKEARTQIQEALKTVEPYTLILSKNLWVRAAKGHATQDVSAIKFKEGDKLQALYEVQSSDMLLLATSHARVFSLSVSNLPSGRSLGEPVQLHCDLSPGEKVIWTGVSGGQANLAQLKSLDLLSKEAAKTTQELGLLFSSGTGARIPLLELLTRPTKGKAKGKALVKLTEGEQIFYFNPQEQDYIAVLSKEERFLVFPSDELPQIKRGRGSQLLSKRAGPLAVVIPFGSDQGLALGVRGKHYSLSEMKPFCGKRGAVGKKQSPLQSQTVILLAKTQGVVL